MVARDGVLRCAELRQHSTFCSCYTLYRHRVTSHHAHWPSPHAFQRSRFLKFGTFPLESGAVVLFSLTAILSNPPMGIFVCRVLSGFLLPPLPRSLQQYVWLFFCKLSLDFYLDRYFTSQVFMILNLNGNFLFISSDLSKVDVD